MAELGTVIVSEETDDFVELARSKSGTLYRKQILHLGSFQHPTQPGKKVQVTKDVARQMVDNFNSGVCDIVQVPLVNEKNQHVEDPLRNIGEVVDLDFDDKGVYATIDARKKEYADELGKTLIGASAMMHLDYTDTKTGKKVGPTLLHVAVTNRPYITNLEGFSQISLSRADTDEDEEPTVLLTPATDAPTEEHKMTKDELIAALRDEHGIDVTELLSMSNNSGDDGQQELLGAIAGVLREAGSLSLSNTDDEDELKVADVAAAVIELSQEKLELSATVASLKEKSDKLELSAAKDEVRQMVKAGRILPAQEEAMLELKLTNPDMFDRVVPDAPLIEMSARGYETHEAPDSKKFSEEIDRLAELANTSGRRTGRK